MYDEKDLVPGESFTVRQLDSVTTITPHRSSRIVVVHHVGCGIVYYRVEGNKKVNQTTVDRFLEVINEDATK